MAIFSEKNQEQKVCIWIDNLLISIWLDGNSVVLPLEENLVSWISIYSS